MKGANTEICSAEPIFVFSAEAIEKYLADKSAAGVSAVTIGKYRTTLQNLLKWSADDATLTPRRMRDWRQSLVGCGYGKITVQRYVTVANDFLRAVGAPELCIPKPIQNDLTGKTFGYLTVIEATEKRKRRDVVWRCVCKCGRETEVPTVLLLGGNTTSCGCLSKEILRQANRYAEGTSLRQSLDDRVLSDRAVSGYVGVQPRRGKWLAYINYKGIRYNLGTYSKLEDAVRARARGKEWVMEDAARLDEIYSASFGEGKRPKDGTNKSAKRNGSTA